jgi:phenylpropionate dioxygenase-like ring-hydroxylating dioxygenase large terminal subunit
MTTKLQAINQMLSGIGQAPVVSIDVANPELALALEILDSVNRAVQGEGWHFNTEVNYPFMADNNGEVTVPPNTLSISDNKTSNTQRYQTVLRNGKLYDKIYHTYQFDAGKPVLCDVVWFFEYEDLPQVFKDYVTHRAARLFAGRALGSEAMVQFNAVDESILRANCLAYDTNTSEVNIFGLETGQNFYVSYTPFRAIAR